ncbi:hypothetical protein XENTR_v10018777 [Xenopus tropicalis]|uniref:Uncharacterized LOC105947790 n=1 Tax=Xenopus tropicalis TaxID=8364 RepID=A0A6I8SKK1_XENTR|nr:uncharacterized protein LOC105947790 [Xenopus tropicalis]KAE8592511.1 hypothetical protein XENTR_v10018777 [Xenopus tropicalis]|eukprot:XP_012822483.1 PREDICTED: uncharacterized protein LOC105947790 [Xenopus tropicalis]
MLASLLTALFFVVRVFGKLGSTIFREERAPYLMYQPLPWHVQYVTQNRRASRDQERRGSCQYTCTTYPARDNYGVRRPSPRMEFSGEDAPERAALTIQTHYRKYQQNKQNQG